MPAKSSLKSMLCAYIALTSAAFASDVCSPPPQTVDSGVPPSASATLSAATAQGFNLLASPTPIESRTHHFAWATTVSGRSSTHVLAKYSASFSQSYTIHTSPQQKKTHHHTN